tara:strand:+ start:269 stop:529 length:261 start_codon:yes stop_codon:yes gene_type:complete
MIYVLGKAKFIKVMANILLDSDALCSDKSLAESKNDKLQIVRRAYEFVEYLTNDDMIDSHENHVKDIIEELYGCSGLIGTLIFNLN